MNQNETPIHLNSKGNEVIVWCSFTIWLCLLLNSHYPYMCYRCQCLLHRISASRINNDNIHQGLEVISGDKDIHLLSNVVNEKVGDLPLNMCSTIRSNNYNNISKCIVNYYMFISSRALKQMSTQIVKGMNKLTLWKMGNRKMWQAKTCM
jgi:hypothetical protein